MKSKAKLVAAIDWQISSIFWPTYAHVARRMAGEGKLTIIPVKDFPEGAPRTNDAGIRAYFAIKATPKRKAEFDRRCDQQMRRLKAAWTRRRRLAAKRRAA